MEDKLQLKRRASAQLVWATNLTQRVAKLRKQRVIPDFYSLEKASRRRRPRIRKPKQVVIRVCGCEDTISYNDYLNHCDEETIVIRKIY
jgi:hypothetical protein